MEGYDAKFDPPLEKRLECPICLLAQREPMQTPCGHRFCSACILRALRETGPRCPVDNTTVCVHQLFKDNFAKREVLSLNVHCSADQCGCPWQGELRDLQVHSRQCELVLIDCPNSCGHSCRRQNLHDHLPSCTNRPEKCATCSISFPRSSLADHQPHCSHITIPDSVSAAIDKAGEVLKWVGNLKLKLNGQVCQLTGYLTAPIDSEQSHLATSSWCSSITFITLNSLASQIFSRMLTSSEVQPVQLNFALLTSDPRSTAFQKIFRKKPEICNAAVCLRLRPGNRRETRELTIMYLSWCDSRKRLQAYIANLKTHLVRQIQTHLQDIQGSRRHRRMRSNISHSSHHHPPSSSSSSSSSASQSRPLGSAPHDHHTHPYARPRVHLHQATPTAMPNAPPTAPPPPPQPLINIQPLPPHQVVAAAAAGSSPAILPNLLSWQMSQSFNTYPWRMQATGVPFFTFPSTPPSFIPANSYPYTFAPLPAAPFSISPMQPVPTTVHMPSYNGLSVVVPQVTTVDAASAVPLNANQGNVVTQGYAVAAAPNAAAAAVPSQPVMDRELQAVAVTIGGEGNQVLHVIQPRNSSRVLPPTDHPLHAYHQNLGLSTAPPALIPTDHHHTPQQPQQPPLHPQSSVASSSAPYVFDMTPSQTGNGSDIPPQNQRSAHSLPTAHHSGSLQSRMSGSGSYTPVLPPVQPSSMWDEIPGPSGLVQVAQPADLQSGSSRDSTPEAPNFSLFSPGEDSDTSHLPEIPVSPAPLFDESSGILSSDAEESSAENTPHNLSTDSSSSSALHTLADAAAILADSPNAGGPQSSSLVSASSSGQSNPLGQPVRVPVLINISDSESDAHLSPSSIIDLTQSPTLATRHHPPSHSQGDPYNYGVMDSNTAPPPPPPQAPAAAQQSAHLAAPLHQEPPPPPPGIHGDNHISAVLVPVIHHWSGNNDQGLHPIQPFISGEQVGVVQAAAVPVEEPPTHVHPTPANLTSDVGPVPIPQAGYPIHEYPGQRNWPQEMQAQGHSAVQRTLLYPPPPPPPQQQQASVGNPPQGDFWDTVIPSLDMTLQNSANSEN